jgi:hypothetical protein
MDPSRLAAVLGSSGLATTVLPGFYNPHRCLRGIISRGLNAAIKTSGNYGLALAPSYIIVGERS